MSAEIIQLLDELKFKGMANIFPELLVKAERDGWSHQDLLQQLLSEELRYRRERSTLYRLGQAKIPWTWTLNTFPYEQQPSVDRTRIRLGFGSTCICCKPLI